MITYIKLEPWLAQWLKHENGEPVEFEKGSVEYRLLEVSLISSAPICNTPRKEENCIEIKIPKFKNFENDKYYYLPCHGRKQLKKLIRSRFVLNLWEELHKFGSIGKKKMDIIYAFMEAKGIDQTESNFFALFKIYQRQRRYYLRKNAEKR